ncbi:uncharacterized protein LOC131937367 [Physella acuta]|uniref:uncharacterized protein LOC131937367 n=1 Tax=Physella acuta TaxID=109671 RepID=UPI0027DD255B|nr:uncharacterized protein LOC131937367 [Physella acuta]
MDSKFSPPKPSNIQKIKFNSTRPLHGTVILKEADCPDDISIRQLKEDVETLYNIPAADQVWHHGNTLLSDEQTLKDYNIKHGDHISVQHQHQRYMRNKGPHV